MRTVAFLSSLVLAAPLLPAAPALAAPPGVVVVSAVEQGILTSTPGTIVARDVAASTRLNGQIRWVFGDTLYRRSSGAPVHPADDYRSATHATSPLIANPWRLTNVLDAGTGVPHQLLPHTAVELAYNRERNDPSDRYALWPTSIVARDSTRAQIIYSRMLVQPGELDYVDLGVGIADLTAGQNTATRSGLLFSGAEFRFGASGGLYDSATTTLYLYQCWNRADYDYPCRLARVSLRNDAGVVDWNRTKVKSNYRAAVRAPGGAISWTPDLTQATEIVQGSPTGWSVAWNPGLGKYVAFLNVPLTSRIELRTAPAPEGPWSEPLAVLPGQAPSCLPGTLICADYAVQQHPELAVHGTGTSTVYLTYARPAYSTAAPYRLDLNVVQVKLRV
ncbi:hypothetical protein AB0F81_17300 [Actinoplanes sp. NPDC024001]|uniref:DUF4185 domain-containing protein n=1 Tax=Actinoplanes sp. NPDC024001 TaxID=3154598 RepID=UPI003407C009